MIRGTVASVAALGAALFYQPSQAEACGGFFCNNAQPVNQQAERIIFSQNADGTVTAIVQILYTGPAERFAWVLPIEGAPEIGVSSNIVFQRLQAMTNPQYTLTQRTEGTCNDEFGGGGRGTFAPSADSAGGPPAFAGDAGQAAPPPVTVVDAGSVGPYDWVAIMVDPEAPAIADVAVDWLQENGYDIDDSGRRTLEPYLLAGMNLVAFRLTKTSDTGSIRPVTITFRTARPGIPILPTAVAAEEDMGVMVWVLGEHRAIPENYMHLQLNDALINWFSPAGTYGDVVTAAANEAGGQGFVTEQAGPTEELQPLAQDWELESLAARFAGSSDSEVILGVTQNLQGWDGLREALVANVEFDETFTVDQLLGCPWCGGADVRFQAGKTAESFLDDVDEQVVAPVRAAQELIDSQPYITRLYTTMSPADMTRDPLFDFNEQLGAISNVHTADWVIECNRWVTFDEAPWRIELPSGDVLRGSGQARTWPFGMDDVSMPANARIERLETTGMGSVVEDNVGEITQAINNYNETLSNSGRSGGGCSASGSSWAGSALLMVFASLLFVRRRKG